MSKKNNNDSSHKKNAKDKFATVIGIGLLIIMMVGFVFGLYFFGMAGVFELLGVQYESIWSLVVFVVSFIIVGIFVEIFSKAFYKLTVRYITRRVNVLLIRISFQGLSNWFVLFTVDEFMESITLSAATEMMIAMLVAVLEIAFDDDKE